MSKLYLQSIVDDISFDNLPAKWQEVNIDKYSKDKTLFDFQQQGLQNALKGLWLYFKNKNGKSYGRGFFMDLKTKRFIIKE
ncbi:MAG: hypothetical protein ACK4NX_03880, partial [Candidatus Paceibacteria bacterium]